MRVEEPMLSMVATRRSADRRSGASVPKARQAPLNSSILAMRLSISGVIWMVSVRNMNQYCTHLHPFARCTHSDAHLHPIWRDLDVAENDSLNLRKKCGEWRGV